MIKLEAVLNKEVKPSLPDEKTYKQIKHNWDTVAKPLDSMGKYEGLLCKTGAILKDESVDISKTAIVIMCADNGIVEEGISQSDQSVTAICTENIAAGTTAVGVMAQSIGTKIIAVDVGVNSPKDFSTCGNVISKRVRSGTRNFLKEPAMTKAECYKAIQLGMNLIKKCKDAGYTMVGTGEMGIGNTTTSAAVCAALLGFKASQVTGRGAGLDDARLMHKIEVVETAIKKYGFDKYDAMHNDPLEVLRKVGGLDIAGLVGIMIGGAIYQVPIVLDGVITMVAALVAERLVPGVKEYLIPSHISREPAAKAICEELKLSPVIDADMAVGEGTGAVMMISLLKMAHSVYSSCNSFAVSGVGQYERFDNPNKVIVVVGGSGSGKSAYAEELVLREKHSKRYYLATMQVYDEEGRRKVAKHRNMRAEKGFETIECQHDLLKAIQAGMSTSDEYKASTALLECISNLVANEMFRDGEIIPAQVVVEKVSKEIKALSEIFGTLIIVTNNIAEDGNRYDDTTMQYIKAIGEINQRIMELSTEAYEVVVGIPLSLK